MLLEFVSEEFTTLTGLRTARKEVRDKLLMKLYGTTTKRARLHSDCYVLEMKILGEWRKNLTGFTKAEDKVKSWEDWNEEGGPTRVFRLKVLAAT